MPTCVFRRLQWLALFSLLVLNGCASLGTSPENPLPAPTGKAADLHITHMKQLAQIDRFQLQARIGIQSAGKGSSGSTRWRHDPSGNDISMLSPIGSTVAKIITNADGVTLTTNDGKVLKADNAETLTQEHLGWRLPLAGLPDWALGRPTRSLVQEMQWDSIGRIKTLHQDGWEIEYLEYMEAGGYRLPKKINLHSRNLTLKLVIESWGNLNVPKSAASQRMK